MINNTFKVRITYHGLGFISITNFGFSTILKCLQINYDLLKLIVFKCIPLTDMSNVKRILIKNIILVLNK